MLFLVNSCSHVYIQSPHACITIERKQYGSTKSIHVQLRNLQLRLKIVSFVTPSWLTGYLEDRRPASNMDPYVVTSLLAESTILWEPTLEAEVLAAKKLALKV